MASCWFPATPELDRQRQSPDRFTLNESGDRDEDTEMLDLPEPAHKGESTDDKEYLTPLQSNF
jgi:hypothetical protein